LRNLNQTEVSKKKTKLQGECRNCLKKISSDQIRVHVKKIMDNRFFHIQCYKNLDPPSKIKIQPELENNTQVQEYYKKWEEEFEEKYTTKKRTIETIYEVVETMKKRKLTLSSEEYFFNIPNEIWILVLSFLPFREIVHKFSIVSKSCLEITYEDNLWRELVLTYFGKKFLESNSEEFENDHFKLFIKLQNEICSVCKRVTEKKNHFGPLDCLICEVCVEKPEYQLVTVSQARNKFKLTDQDLKLLKFHKEWNPNNKKVPKISYLKSDAEALALSKRKEDLIGELLALKVDLNLVDFGPNSLAESFIRKTTAKKSKSIAFDIMNNLK
jgi:hypothetical protein